MQPMIREKALELIHAGEDGDCRCEEWARTDLGVWIGPQVATEVQFRWYGEDRFVCSERISYEFATTFPRYLGNYDPDRDGLTCDAWWLKRVERLHDESAVFVIEGDQTNKFECEAHGVHSGAEHGYGGKCYDCSDCHLVVVDVTPDPLLQRVTNEPL